MSEPINPATTTPERILQRLDWQVVRRLDGLLQGDYRTLFYGNGVDFADLREYQPQDDIRRIDWNVTARLTVPHVRQYAEDREVTGWFLLDLSGSMGFGPQGRPKSSILRDLTAVLARLLTRNGNRVGAILYCNGQTELIPPRTSKNQVLRLLRALLATSAKPAGSRTDLNILLRAAQQAVKRRSLIFLLSDFISEPGWQQPLRLLRRRHELIAIRLWDPQEMELPDAGFIVVEDAETGEQLPVDTSNPTLRRRFFAVAAEREAELRAAFKRAGIDMFGVATDDDIVAAIVRLAQLRKLRRGQR